MGYCPRPMRKTLAVLVVGSALFLGSEAQAQFANKSLGLSVGFLSIQGDRNLQFALPLTVDGTMYVENGFDVYLHVALMLVQVSVGAPTANGQGLVFGFGGHLGIRYLFSEESFRPWLGLELAGAGLLVQPSAFGFGGPGVAGGIDYFVADTVSIGARAYFDLFIELNRPIRPSIGGAVSVATYF